jgi:transcriptional regulator with XRE-family HTH domain
MKKIGDEIKKLRIENGLSADELAARLGRKGINRKQYVYDIENGKIQKIEPVLLRRICAIFNITPNHFYSYLSSEQIDYFQTAEEMPVLYSKGIDEETRLSYAVRQITRLSTKISSLHKITLIQEERIHNLEKKILALITLLEVDEAMKDILIRTKPDGTGD